MRDLRRSHRRLPRSWESSWVRNAALLVVTLVTARLLASDDAPQKKQPFPIVEERRASLVPQEGEQMVTAWQASNAVTSPIVVNTVDSNPTKKKKKVSREGFTYFSIVDARNIRAPAYFHAEPGVKLGVIFEAYGRLRNDGDSKVFFFKPGLPFTLLSPMDAVDQVVASKSIVVAAVATDPSDLCGPPAGQHFESFFQIRSAFVADPQDTAYPRYARLCAGCAFADVARPDWRNVQGFDPRNTNTVATLQSYLSGLGTRIQFKPENQNSSDPLEFDEETVFAELANPWRVAERELREAVRFGSKAARVALARLVVVAAHFEARPSFLDEAKEALRGGETDDVEDSFADAVAAGTALAAEKASRLLARECAAEVADVDVVASAIAAGADVDTRSDSFGHATILQWAAYRGHSKVVASLLVAGADPYLSNDDGLTPADVVDDDDTRRVLKDHGLPVDDFDFDNGSPSDAAADEDPPSSESDDEAKPTDDVDVDRGAVASEEEADATTEPTVPSSGVQHQGTVAKAQVEAALRSHSEAPRPTPVPEESTPPEPPTKPTTLQQSPQPWRRPLPFAVMNTWWWWWLELVSDFIAMTGIYCLARKYYPDVVNAPGTAAGKAVLRLRRKLAVIDVEKAFQALRYRFTAPKKNNSSERRPTKKEPPRQKSQQQRQKPPQTQQQPTLPTPSKRKPVVQQLDIADTLETLDLGALSLETLEKLDKLLPKLQRRVLKEVLDREKETRPTTSPADDDLAHECVVCLAAARTVAFGCGHLCCCEACGRDVVDCPICRTPVVSRHRIFNTT